MNDIIYDVIVIGAGPNGINAGIELSKSNLEFCILEKGVLVNSIFHFPVNMTFFSTSEKLEIGDIPFISHGDKPTRREALEYYRRIVEYYALPIHYRTKAISISPFGTLFRLETNQGNYLSKKIILATGYFDTPVKLRIPGEELPKVKHYYDDAHHYIGQKIIVVGGANSACDVALETWQKGADVTMVVRDSQLYQKVKYWILPSIENRIKEGSIKTYFDSSLVKIDEKKVWVQTPEGLISLDNDYVLAMVGYQPDYKMLKDFGIAFSDNSINSPIHDPVNFESNIPGIYVSGVIRSGLNTSALFIENTREEAKMIVEHIKKGLTNE